MGAFYINYPSLQKKIPEQKVWYDAHSLTGVTHSIDYSQINVMITVFFIEGNFSYSSNDYSSYCLNPNFVISFLILDASSHTDETRRQRETKR